MLDCFDYALSYLSRYPKTSFDMKQVLKKKGYGELEIDNTISLLLEKQYLNDRNYTFLYVSSEVGRKGKPLFIVQQKLRQKGVDKQLIDEIVSELEEECFLGIQKRIVKEKAKMQERGLSDAKIIERLQRRGYTYTQIKYVLEV